MAFFNLTDGEMIRGQPVGVDDNLDLAHVAAFDAGWATPGNRAKRGECCRSPNRAAPPAARP